MKRTLLGSLGLPGLLGLMLAACTSDSIPNVSRVDDNVQYYTKKVQDRSDEAARACLRVAKEAGEVCTEILARLHRNESVSRWAYRRLTKADTAMQETCRPFR